MTLSLRVQLVGLLSLVYLVAGGCKPAEAPKVEPAKGVEKHDHDHDHDHEHHETYADAVKEIDELRESIKTSFAKPDLLAADAPVHEIGHVLEEVPALAEKASLGETERAEIKTAVDALMDNFGKLDETVHAGKGTMYDDVHDKIDEAIKTLQKHLPPAK